VTRTSSSRPSPTSTSGARGERAEEFGAHHWYTDYRPLLARDDVHVVSLCLPHHLHRDVAIDAARAGKHVLCEKPLALDVSEADAMIAAARQAGVQLGVIERLLLDRAMRPLERRVPAVLSVAAP
jgi:predicted dehydrogenase